MAPKKVTYGESLTELDKGELEIELENLEHKKTAPNREEIHGLKIDLIKAHIALRELNSFKEREEKRKQFFIDVKGLFEDVSGTPINCMADANRAVERIIHERQVRIRQEQRIQTLEKVIVDQAIELRSLRNERDR